MKESRFCLNNAGNRHTKGLLEQVRTKIYEAWAQVGHIIW